MELDFKIIVEDVSIYGINSFLKIPLDYDIDYYSDRPSVYVEYELQPELKRWGINWISILIKKVISFIEWHIDCQDIPNDEIELLVSAGGKYDNNMVKGFIRIDTTIDNSWNVINNVEIKSNGEILISEVEIDLKTKSISLC